MEKQTYPSTVLWLACNKLCMNKRKLFLQFHIQLLYFLVCHLKKKTITKHDSVSQAVTNCSSCISRTYLKMFRAEWQYSVWPESWFKCSQMFCRVLPVGNVLTVPFHMFLNWSPNVTGHKITQPDRTLSGTQHSYLIYHVHPDKSP